MRSLDSPDVHWGCSRYHLASICLLPFELIIMDKYIKYFKVIFLSLALILFLSAIGCKKKETPETTTTPTSEAVTYKPKITETPTETTKIKSTEEQNKEAAPTDTSTKSTTPQATGDEEKLLLDQAEKLAEIFGTFTNKDKEPYKNLKDLKQYSTEKMQKWLDEKSKTPVDPAAPFYGVTTKAISSAILEGDTTKKKILVTTEREEIKVTSKTPKVSFKLLLMDFEKVGEGWKLSGVYWQN